jgi:thiamine-monophosphate kinase
MDREQGTGNREQDGGRQTAAVAGRSSTAPATGDLRHPVLRRDRAGATVPCSLFPVPSALGPGPEFDLIRRFLADAPAGAREDVPVGPGDDCAVVLGRGIALSSDMSVEGTHFRREWFSPFDVGGRAATAALSDLAAMAARPIGVLVSLAIRPEDAGDYAASLMAGVRAAAERVGGVLLGGDLARTTGPLVVDVTVVGEAAAPVLRSGARPGDELWVTGELGAAAAAVAGLLRGEAPHPDALERLRHPVARVAEALWLRERGLATAMIDLSDGLAGDAAHLAAASGVRVVLDPDAVPVHPAVRAGGAGHDEALRLAASGGEDYELCLAAPPGRLGPLRAQFEAELGVGLTRVGRVEEGAGTFWQRAGGERRPAGAGGFQHFA